MSNSSANSSNKSENISSASSHVFTSSLNHEQPIKKTVGRKRKEISAAGEKISAGGDNNFLRSSHETIVVPVYRITDHHEVITTYIKGFERYLPDPNSDKPSLVLNPQATIDTAPEKMLFTLNTDKVKKLMETTSWKGIGRHHEKNYFVRVASFINENGQPKKILEDIYINQHLHIIYSLMLCWLSEKKETREMLVRPDDYVPLIKKVGLFCYYCF